MNSHYRSLLLVMVITTIAFKVLQPIFAPMMVDPKDYPKRRNLWLTITAISFISPSIWIYFALAGIFIYLARKKDANEVSIFPLLLLAVPPSGVELEGVFNIDHPLMLVATILIPIAWGIFHGKTNYKSEKTAVDFLVMSMIFLHAILYSPHMSITALMRILVLDTLTAWIIYYVFSRSIDSIGKVRDTLACLVLPQIVMAPLAIAESTLGTLLYGGVPLNWGLPTISSYLTREGLLRTQLASGQAIVLGYQFTIGLIIWLYLQSLVKIGNLRILCTIGLVISIILPFSRGPWVAASAAVLCYILLGRNGVAKLFRWGPIIGLIFAGSLVTPLGDKIISQLPFVGTAEQATIAYRNQMNEASIALIMRNPFLGNPFARQELTAFRTGEGIVDILNVYISFALHFGIIYTALFISIFATVMWQLLGVALSKSRTDEDRNISSSLFSALLAVTIMLAGVSNYLTIPYNYYTIIGISSGFLVLSRRTQK